MRTRATRTSRADPASGHRQHPGKGRGAHRSGPFDSQSRGTSTARVDAREQDQAGEESADMRLPGNAALGDPERRGADTEEQV